MSYSLILDHRTMLYDDHRNKQYKKAINGLVSTDSVVLDLGAGSGIHGLVAARAGAKVYLVEPETKLDTANRVAIENGLADNVICISSTVEQASIDEPVDVIISVFTGNFLLEEDLLPSLFFARDRFLAKNGSLIPNRAVMEIVPVTAPNIYEKYITCWSRAAQSIDFSLVKEYASNRLYFDDYSALTGNFLAASVEVLDLDLMKATSASCDSRVTVTITKDGECHGFLGWFKMQIGDEWLSTSPIDPKTHWSQAFLPLDPPLSVEAGEEIEFKLQRPEFGEWTWTVVSRNISQRHSTFLSEPLAIQRLQKQSDNYQATLSEQGELALQVMKRLDGSESTLSIAEDIALTHPELFPTIRHGKTFILSLVDHYC